MLVARLLGLPRREARHRAAELITRFGLADAAGRRVRTYSGGMRRRLDLAVSLVGRPDVLFLDEPTTGLDPRHRNEVWDEVRALAVDGTTVLLTTQYLEEAEQLADDLVVLDHGRVIAAGTPAALKAEVGGQRLHVRPLRPTDLPAVTALVAGLAPGAAPAADAAGELTVAAPDPGLLVRVADRLDAAGLPVAELGLRLPSLDDVFLTLTGRPAADAAEECRMTTTTVRSAAPPPVVVSHSWLPDVVRQSATLAWRGVTKTVHSTEALLDVTLQPVIFLLLFVYVFGGAIAGDPGTYLQYALPGVLVQTVVFASAGTGTGLADDLKTGIFDRFRSLPISRTAPLLGAIGADLVRYVTSGAIMLAFGFLLGFRASGGLVGVLGALGLVTVFAFALCWVFTALAMVVREPRSVQGLGALVMLPLTFGSNVFVPTATLPGWLQGFVEVNPVSKVADAARGLLTGGAVAGPAIASLLASAALVAVFGPLAAALYRRRT